LSARSWRGTMLAMGGFMAACSSPGGLGGGGSSPIPSGAFTGAAGEVKLVTLDPGHFHAALVQKSMYEQVDPRVHVFAPAGPDVAEHLARIEAYNTREEDPTAWVE